MSVLRLFGVFMGMHGVFVGDNWFCIWCFLFSVFFFGANGLALANDIDEVAVVVGQAGIVLEYASALKARIARA